MAWQPHAKLEAPRCVETLNGSVIAKLSVLKHATPTRNSYLETLASKRIIEKQSVGWLTGALDPFHDFQYTPEGLPDQYSGPSVVQFLKRKVTISKPAGLADGTQWDCHIFTAPVMKTQSAVAGATVPGAFTEKLSGGAYWGSASIGTVNIHCCATGGNTLPSTVDAAPPTNFVSFSNSPCDNGNDFSMMRLIGGGFEVHNDTPELYLGGSVSVYSQPTEVDSQFMVATSGATTAIGSSYKARMPPSNIQEAVSNVSARTWEARFGSYSTFQLDIEHLQFSQASPQPLIMARVDQSADYTSFSPTWETRLDLTAQPTDPADVFYSTYASYSPLRLASIETSGAYYTGLDQHSVLTLDIVFIVEVAPTPANTTLISLATPSAEYDPEALVLYSRALRELPPGVKVAMNAAGDWWRMVSNAVTFVAPILSQMGPYGKVAATTALAAKSVGDSVQAHRAQKKDQKNAVQTANPRTAPDTGPSKPSPKKLGRK